MNEYKVTCYSGFDSKELYTRAENAEALQKEMEENLAFEISEGMTYKIEKL